MTEGVCHICRAWTQVSWLSCCHHWLCPECKEHYLRRAMAAGMQLIRRILGRLKRLDVPCCGPGADPNDG